MNTDYQSILDFWFSSENQPFWFQRNEQFDEKIHQQFGALWLKAAQGELYSWRKTLQGRLAEIIVLDQFSRNLYRNSPLAFSQDGMALVLCQEAMAQAEFEQMSIAERHFILMPLMHSESKEMHRIALQEFEKLGTEKAIEFELKHKVIIDRFGRYPHRNSILGRENTLEESEFLKTHSGF